MSEKNKACWKRRVLNVTWIVYVLVNMVILVFQIDKMFCRDYTEIAQYFDISEGWDVRINQEEFHAVSLEGFSFPTVEKGDYIVMEKKLPKDWDIRQGALRLHIQHSAVTMYVDGGLVYEYGRERLAQNKTVGSGYQFVDFPEDYQGKMLRIEWSVAENHAFSMFEPLHIYEWSNIYRVLITENRLSLFLGGFLIIFGISILMITAVAILFSRRFFRMFCIALFSICVGLWTLCYYNVMLIFSIPLYSITLIEYMALYLAPIPVTIYMYENVKALKNKFFTVLFWLLFGIEIGFDAVILTLHTMDIVHCAAVLRYMQGIIVLCLVYFSVILFLNMKVSRFVNRLYLFGMLVIFGCAGYDLAQYQLQHYYGKAGASVNGVTSVGVLVFIFILILSFYINLTKNMMQETERNILIKRAYTDELTQMYNRRYCAEYMDKIAGTESDYTIFCFDLNDLKFVNDTYGHVKGDVLIRSAANAIADAFSEEGVVGRMGGDEFIAILPFSEGEKLERLREKLHHNIEEANREDEELNLSVAYGYAVSAESAERNVEKVFQIADDRMYQDKNAYKKRRQHRGNEGKDET